MRSAAVYACAKDRPGPVIRAVEEAVKSVVSPVYQKFHLLPDELLRLPDHSGAAVHAAPAYSRNSAPDIARTVCSKCEPAANVLYERYESKAAAAWRGLNRIPLLLRAAEKCNEAVAAAAEKSHRFSSRLNVVVPVKRVAKVFGEKQ